jgi:general secretion pathway protein E
MKNDLPLQQPSEVEIVELRKLSEEYGVEFIDVLSDDSIDPVLVARLPVEWARTNYLLPVRISGEVCVLTADPASVVQQEYLALLIGQELRPILAPKSLIARSIERCYYSKDDSPDDFLRDFAADNKNTNRILTTTDDLLQVAEKAPVTQLVNLILLEAVKRNASDIHFEPLEARLRVRYRIDGILYEQASPPKHVEESLVSRLKVMAHMDIAEKRLPQDGMARVRVGEREIDVRVSTIPVAEGERVVLRLLNRDSSLLPLSVLGMSDNNLQSFEALLREPNGIIVVSGPTGSGKTTTLYAALGQLDASRKNIMTIEDPVEYQLPNIGQIQVKPKIGLTFATGLRHILRQDPDIVLVGETRDSETASISVRASLTGHLVFTTLHTNDAPSAILRLIDMGVEPYLLASCLRGILAQRLVRNLCRECRTKMVVQEREIKSLGLKGTDLRGRQVWAPSGCPSCLEGYKGRSGIFELIVLDREMQDMVRTGNAGVDELRKLTEMKGMVSLLADGLNKVLAGVTSLAEVVSVAA